MQTWGWRGPEPLGIAQLPSTTLGDWVTQHLVVGAYPGTTGLIHSTVFLVGKTSIRYLTYPSSLKGDHFESIT